METPPPLPPGQRERADFPRFGLGKFARRFPAHPGTIRIRIEGDVRSPADISDIFATLPRTEQVSDFHCVTTWSVRGLTWSGVRFADFHRLVALPSAQPAEDAIWVVLHGEDGYRSILLLEDLLADDVLLADRLDGEPIPIAHGAPLRLVAPAHYGYKNVKHIQRIEYRRNRRRYRFPWPYPGLMDHPRARVALEERAIGLPAKLARILYRPLIAGTVRNFRTALEKKALRRPGTKR